jgi:competence ComEA-like helix-hairpin-helix protein
VWGRELRAGLVFVLVSLLVGSAVRGWQRSHRERFSEIVESLAEYDAAASLRSGRPVSSTDSLPSAAPPDDRRVRRAADTLRPASIDVDRAEAAELERLPGIGPALAARIVAERRARGAFGGPEGLLRVTGIGPKTLAKLRPYLSVSSSGAWRSDSVRAK